MSGWSAIRDWRRRHPRWAVALALVVLVGVAAAAYAVSRDAQAREQWRQAQSALATYEFDRAREHLRAYLGWRYFDGRGHFELARACRRARGEDFVQAREHLQAAESLGWRAAEINLEKELTNVQESGEMGTAEAYLKQQLESRPEQRPLILEALARGCIRAGLVNKANAWLDQWVAAAPDDWYARWWRGCLFQHTGKPQLAVEDLSMVLRERPEDASVERQLGLAQAISGYDYQSAVMHLEKCRQRDAADSEMLVWLADGFRAVGRGEEARPLLERALQERPGDVDGLMTLALVELDAGHDQAAMKAVEQLEKASLGFDAEEALHRLLNLDPVPNPPQLTERKEKLLYLKSAALRRVGRAAEADACVAQLEQIRRLTDELKSALAQQKQRPQDADLMYQIGRSYLDLDLKGEGVTWLNKAVQANPRHQQAHAALADYYQTLDSDEAREKSQYHRKLGREN